MQVINANIIIPIHFKMFIRKSADTALARTIKSLTAHSGFI